MIKKWKFVSRETLLSHPRMNIVEDTVELPNGKTAQYIREAPVSDSAVAVIAINDKGEILVQQEYSYPPDEIMYQLPGGKVDTGEDILLAANRELSEESGYVATSSSVLGSFYMNNRRSDARQYVVLCKDLEAQKLQEDEEEFIESLWLPYADVKDLVQKGKITNMNMLAALQLFDSFETR